MTGERWWLVLVAVGIPLSVWGADYPPNTWLQVGPVMVLLAAAVPILRRWPLSTGSVACVASFLLLHLLAARWTYSNVPYDQWGRTVSGIDIDATFGFKRNMFDRLVHFSFGLLIVKPVDEAFSRHLRLSPAMALYCAIMFVLGVSALYEILEWLLAVFMDPAAADAYNGQQGDVFDSPKDMAMAALGAAVAVACRWRPAER